MGSVRLKNDATMKHNGERILVVVDEFSNIPMEYGSFYGKHTGIQTQVDSKSVEPAIRISIKSQYKSKHM